MTPGPGGRAQEPWGVTREGVYVCFQTRPFLSVPNTQPFCGLQSPINPYPAPPDGEVGRGPEPTSFGRVPRESRQTLSPARTRGTHTRGIAWGPRCPSPCSQKVLNPCIPNTECCPLHFLGSSSGKTQILLFQPEGDFMLPTGAPPCD